MAKQMSSSKTSKNRQKPQLYRNSEKEDIHFRKEYCGQDKLSIVLSDITFSDKMTLDLGGITAQIFHTISPHSEDTTCVYVPEEKVLFLGDSTSEDFFNNGYMDKVLAMIASGTEPDVYYIASGYHSLALEGKLEPLDSYMEKDANVNKDKFFPNLLPYLTVGGQLYALPVDTAPRALYYNKQC